jgi:pyridoxal phosphate enzyme (YggS family)
MSHAIDISEKLNRVQDQIEKAAKKAGRASNEIQLVVVTKRHPVERLQTLIELGVTNLGESYAQEGIAKKEALLENGVNLESVQWHMIGHVQSRKAKSVSQAFDWLHSLDSLKLGHRLNKRAEEKDKVLPVLLEANISGEESKFGFPAHQEDLWPQVADIVEALAALKHLQISGLMSMAPMYTNAEEARPYFSQTRKLRDYLAENFVELDLHHLSMGMSADFEAAILEGATMVRVGSKILGARPN